MEDILWCKIIALLAFHLESLHQIFQKFNRKETYMTRQLLIQTDNLLLLCLVSNLEKLRQQSRPNSSCASSEVSFQMSRARSWHLKFQGLSYQATQWFSQTKSMMYSEGATEPASWMNRYILIFLKWWRHLNRFWTSSVRPLMSISCQESSTSAIHSCRNSLSIPAYSHSFKTNNELR